MKYYNASTKAGERIIAMADRCIYHDLSDIYGRWSRAKQDAFDWCLNQFSLTENSTSFGVGSGNTFGFTASWLGTIDNENILRVETKNNSYLVWLDR